MTDLSVTRVGEVDVVRIERPEVRNALRPESFQELEAAIATSSARCIVVTGADPAFCSGDDVRKIMAARLDGPAPAPRRVPALFSASDVLLHTDIPIVAAVNGVAAGWGVELALYADIRVASEHARFGQLFVKRGLLTGPAGLARLAQVVGREKAAELLFTGEMIDAAEALRIGLVGRVVPHAALLETAMGVAEAIAANPPLAVRATKAGLREALDPDWASLGRWVTATLEDLRQTEDHAESVRAFLDKRDATYHGR